MRHLRVQMTPLLSSVEAHALTYKWARRITQRLLERGVSISPEDNVVYWRDWEAREAYYFLCDLYKLRRKA